jgi:hypothetical protein
MNQQIANGVSCRSGLAGRPAQPDLPKLAMLFLTLCCIGAAEVPKSPYIAIVYRYGDAIIKTNRDTHKFGQNDLRLLYTLSELSNKPVYREAADAHLKWLLQNPPAMADAHRPWMLWDRCFELDADRSRELAEKSGSIRAFAAAYQHTRDEKFLKMIESAMVPVKAPHDQIGLAIDAFGVASKVPEPLATKLRQFADAQDEAFFSTPSKTNAGLAMLCVARYENTGKIKYREQIYSAADAYCRLQPAAEQMSAMGFGSIISLELAAWRSAAKQEYLDFARKYADSAVKTFWNADNPLPKVTEGADTLVLSLLELHLSILHITAVRCPPNTIDR